MARYNKKLVEKMEKICLEKWESVNSVGPEYYKGLISLSDSAIETLAAHIIMDSTSYINNTAWKSDDDIFDFVMMFLELIAEGRVTIYPADGKLAFNKVLGAPPTEAMRIKIEKKIEDSRVLIKNVFLDIIIEQENQKNKPKQV